MRPLLQIVLICLTICRSIHAFDKKTDCKCRPSVSSRIVQGTNAPKSAYPWQLSLQSFHKLYPPDQLDTEMRKLIPDNQKVYGPFFCGAVLLNSRYAITANHCLMKRGHRLGYIYVGYGSTDLVEIYNENKVVKIEKYIEYPNFEIPPNRQIATGDIALIKFKEPIKFSKYVQPACLPDRETDIYEGVLKMTGFGSTVPIRKYQDGTQMNGQELSRFLQQANTKDRSDTMYLCEAHQKEKNAIICVNNSETRESSCVGDSGGPLNFENSMANKSTVIGITSFSPPRYFPDDTIQICSGTTAYTRISNYMNFIREHVGDEYCT